MLTDSILVLTVGRVEPRLPVQIIHRLPQNKCADPKRNKRDKTTLRTVVYNPPSPKVHCVQAPLRRDRAERVERSAEKEREGEHREGKRILVEVHMNKRPLDGVVFGQKVPLQLCEAHPDRNPLLRPETGEDGHVADG